MIKIIIILLIGVAAGVGGAWFWFTQSMDQSLAKVESMTREASTKLQMEKRALTASLESTAIAGVVKSRSTPTTVVPPAAAAPASAGGGIRKCVVNGKTVYSDSECNDKPNSREVKIHDTQGYDSAAIAAQSERAVVALGGKVGNKDGNASNAEGTGESVKEIMMPSNDTVCKYLQGELNRLDTWEKIAVLPSMKNWVVNQRGRFSQQRAQNRC